MEEKKKKELLDYMEKLKKADSVKEIRRIEEEAIRIIRGPQKEEKKD